MLVLQSTCHFVSTRCLSYWCGGCTRFRGVDVLLLIVQFSICDVRMNVLNNVVVSVPTACKCITDYSLFEFVLTLCTTARLAFVLKAAKSLVTVEILGLLFMYIRLHIIYCVLCSTILLSYSADVLCILFPNVHTLDGYDMINIVDENCLLLRC